MIDYALSFPDQATWETLATEQGWVQTNEDGSIYFANSNMAFVVIGDVYPPTPVPLPDPYNPVPYPGYGVNLRFVEGDLPSTMTQYVIAPNPQMYTFAGGWFPAPSA